MARTTVPVAAPPVAAPPVADGSRSPTDDARLDGAATALAAGLTTITAALAAFGTAGGILERMSINSPGLTRWGFGFAALAVALAITARVAPTPTLTRWLLAASAVLFGAALFILVDRAAQIPSTRERPQVQAVMSRGEDLVLEASVEAVGLASSESVRVAVDGFRPLTNGVCERGVEVPDTGTCLVRLYLARLGPDEAGRVETAVRLPLPERRFREVAVLAGTGDLREKCQLLDIPEGSPTEPLGVGTAEGCVRLRVPVFPTTSVTSTETSGGTTA